jgi:16S rRNA (cytidine1402-2'-O)-methyltransferase
MESAQGVGWQRRAFMRETVCGGQSSAGAQVLERLRAGAAVALVSDAGMPAVSDPGAGLVAAAAAAGARVVPVPGPCAALAALVASGLPTAAFHFAGFLPPKAHARRARLAALAGAPLLGLARPPACLSV